MSQLQKYRLMRSIFACLCSAMACVSGPAWSAQHADQSLRNGFKLAQACEIEIDDDMTSYGECIGHAMDRAGRQRKVLQGIYFQAWLMADLAARQNSTGALVLRTRYAQGLTQQMRATGTILDQLCKAKQLPCEPVRQRMAQKLE